MLLWIIDIKGLTKWTKLFLIFGMNPLFIYAFSEFLAISTFIKVAQSQEGEPVDMASWIYNTIFLPLAGTYNGSLLYALTFTMICWLVGWFLFNKKIFIKL